MIGTVLTVVKVVGGLTVSTGVGAVARNLVKVTTPANISKLTKVCVGVGTVVVSGLASKAASDQFSGAVDKVHDGVTKIVKQVKNQKDSEQTEETVEQEAEA